MHPASLGQGTASPSASQTMATKLEGGWPSSETTLMAPSCVTLGRVPEFQFTVYSSANVGISATSPGWPRGGLSWVGHTGSLARHLAHNKDPTQVSGFYLPFALSNHVPWKGAK